jgi:hypothetical protein
MSNLPTKLLWSSLLRYSFAWENSGSTKESRSLCYSRRNDVRSFVGELSGNTATYIKYAINIYPIYSRKMSSSFAKDATKYYYQMRKTNTNYKFANALKDWSAQLKKGKSSANKTMKNMKKRTEETVQDATNDIVDTVSELNPFSKKHKNKKGTRNRNSKPKSRGRRRRRSNRH